MIEIRTDVRGAVAELRSFEEQWFNFESGYTEDVTTPTLENGGFDFEPIKELLNTLKLGIMCTLPQLLKGDSQYKTPVEYTIVNLNPELEEKFQFNQEACTLLVEELCEWTVEIRPHNEQSSSVKHSFTPTGRRGGVWLAHKSYASSGQFSADLPNENGIYRMDHFHPYIDLYENERLIDRVPVRYRLGVLFPSDNKVVSVLRGDRTLLLPTPGLHQDSLRWFSSENHEVAQHEPREVGETTFYLKGWCRGTEQWIQVMDDEEAPVTRNIIVNEWDFQSILDSIRFQLLGDENGIFLAGKWKTKGVMPSVIRWNNVTAQASDGFSVEIFERTIEIRCNGTGGYTSSVDFKIDGFDDVANRTFAFPSERDFDGEALDRIAISLISRDGNIIAIDYDTTDLPEGLTKTIHLWAGSKYAIEIRPGEHKTVKLRKPLPTESIFAEPAWHPYGKTIRHELTTVTEKVSQPPPFALDTHKRHLAWHPKLVDLSNQTPPLPHENALKQHLVSVNTELELDGIHDATLRPLLFQFHEDGQTIVHKLMPFDSTYTEPQPFYIVYDESRDDLNALRINDSEFQSGDKFFGPKGGLSFSEPGHYIVAVQPHDGENIVLGGPRNRRSADHSPVVDHDKWHYGRRYTKIVCIEVV